LGGGEERFLSAQADAFVPIWLLEEAGTWRQHTRKRRAAKEKKPVLFYATFRE